MIGTNVASRRASLMGSLRGSIRLLGFLRLRLRLDGEGHRPDRLDAGTGLKGAASRIERRRQVGQGPDLAALLVALEAVSVVMPHGVDLGRLPGQGTQRPRPL